jgi:hypothetical protein
VVDDDFSSTFPLKVRVVKVVVGVLVVQICSKFLWRLEFIHVNVRAIWRNEGIFFRPGPHHYRQEVVTGTVEIEGHVISTNRTQILKLS